MKNVKNTNFKEIMGTQTYTIPETEMMKERSFNTQNYFIYDRDLQDFFDDRVKGGMQSYHADTGASIACTAEYKGMKVPEILLSGHHANIEKWRQQNSLENTKRNRPDLLD